MIELEDILTQSRPIEDSELFLNLIDLDRLFATSPDAILLNRIASAEPDYVKRRNREIFSRAGRLNFVARCDCGELSGNLNIGRKCTECGVECREDFGSSGEIEHNAWLGIPSIIPGVLHPIAYIVLTNWLTRKWSVNYIDAIIDDTLELPPELEKVVLGRGHKYFYDHFDELMAYFVHHFRFVDKKSKTKHDNVDFIEQFIASYRSVMFCTKLPIMASVLNSVTSADGSSEGRQYADASIQIILDAITDLQQVEETTTRTRPKAVDSSVHRVYRSYITYIQDIARTRLSKKESLARRHILGTRIHFTIRAVIVPHTERYDELYLPWSVAVNLFKLHIIGRLVRNHGISIGDAISRHLLSIVKYDELIDQIMKDLIAECRPEFPGIPMLIVRNPSMRRGALALHYITRIKINVMDKTMNISTLVLKGSNADFDGDAINGLLLVEMDAARAFYVLHPSMRMRATNESEISPDISLPKQSIAVLNAFLQSTD